MLPKALVWSRLDTSGAEHVGCDDRSGLHARGTVIAAAPVPFTCTYELYTDQAWVTARFEAVVEGPGFKRVARLERAAGRWRVTASEQGDLDGALRAAGHASAGFAGSDDPARLREAVDIDLAYSPLTNTLPIRRLGLVGAPPGVTHTIVAAWVIVPGLEVVASTQTYTVLGAGLVRYASGSFTADLAIDDEGFVVHYPGLARRADAIGG